jgi:hypothetical protein
MELRIGETMRFWVCLGFFISFLLCVSAKSQAPFQVSTGTHCLKRNLSRNGKVLNSPQNLVLLDATETETVQSTADAFCVPEKLWNQSALDVSFLAGKDRVYLTRIPIDRFQATWDITVGHIRTKGLPGHRSGKHSCLVVYKYGEPEVAEILSPCIARRGYVLSTTPEQPSQPR